MQLKISLIQTSIHWESIDANLGMLEEILQDVPADANLIVLPEMFSTGFTMKPKYLAEPPKGKTFQWMQMVAKYHQAACVGSYIIREQGHYYNRLYFIYPDGESRQYDKKHLFSLADENKYFSSGNERLVLDFMGWKICLQICYDLRFPIWSRSQKKESQLYEYDMLVYVANWPKARIDAWDTLLKARAIENMAYCAGVNCIGIDGLGKHYPGHTAIYDFEGKKLNTNARLDIFTEMISLDKLHKYRKKYSFQADADSFQFISNESGS